MCFPDEQKGAVVVVPRIGMSICLCSSWTLAINIIRLWNGPVVEFLFRFVCSIAFNTSCTFSKAISLRIWLSFQLSKMQYTLVSFIKRSSSIEISIALLISTWIANSLVMLTITAASTRTSLRNGVKAFTAGRVTIQHDMSDLWSPLDEQPQGWVPTIVSRIASTFLWLFTNCVCILAYHGWCALGTRFPPIVALQKYSSHYCKVFSLTCVKAPVLLLQSARTKRQWFHWFCIDGHATVQIQFESQKRLWLLLSVGLVDVDLVPFRT